jgi:nitrilase
MSSENNAVTRFKVAAVQSSPVLRDGPDWFDLKSSLDKTESLIFEAGRHGARLVVFPECWLPSFPFWGFDFTDRPNYRNLWASYLWNSIEVPSRETEVLGRAAKTAKAYVTVGINERDSKFAGRMYNSILYINPEGEVIGTHRKICNTLGERLFHTPGDSGNNLKAVFKTDIGCLGGSICGEHSQLTLIYNWIMQGIQIHCSLWPGLISTKVESDICTRAVCFAGHSFGVMGANYFKEEDLPRNFYKNCAFNVPQMIRGGSGIVNPMVEYIAGPIYDEETIVYGDVDLLETDKARFAVNLTRNYSRWDLFSLNVRRDIYEPVVPDRAESGITNTPNPDRMKELEGRISQIERKLASFPPYNLRDVCEPK